jgi:hypothetical protein
MVVALLHESELVLSEDMIEVMVDKVITPTPMHICLLDINSNTEDDMIKNL